MSCPVYLIDINEIVTTKEFDGVAFRLAKYIILHNWN